MKAQFEKVEPSFGSSFTYHLIKDKPDTKPIWHFHPELQLVFVAKGSGKRHIGNHLSYYQNGDLVLIGSNLPHMGFQKGLYHNSTEVVVQMRPDFLGNNFMNLPEMGPIENLLERSKLGLAFNGKTKRIVGQKLLNMNDKDALERLLALLEILDILSHSKDYKILNAESYALDIETLDHDRMTAIYGFVKENFSQSIPLEEIAQVANMTVPAFCRYFKKITNKTFITFLNEYRVTHACKLLSESGLSIAEVSFESGFNNLSHFNKSFKKFTQQSPKEYRQAFRQVIQEE